MSFSDNHEIGIPVVPAAFANTEWNCIILMLCFIMDYNRMTN